MTTYAVQAPMVKIGGQVPLFVLPAAGDGKTGPGAVKSKYNLVLLFIDDLDLGGDYLQALEKIYPRILAEHARAMVVISSPLEGIETFAGQRQLPFPLLADEGSQTTRRMLGEDGSNTLCVADRYGQVYFLESSHRVENLPGVEAALDWLEFIQIQCPE
jgi:peroxiredoxin